MMSQPSIALVKRGGRCTKWSEKTAIVQDLSNSHRLQITGIVIYDNIMYNDTNFIQQNTNDASYPTWPSILPRERDINFMTSENDINKGKTFLAVYFVPQSYVEFLNATLLQRTLQKNGTRQSYAQLTFSLKENHFITSADPSRTSSLGENSSSKSNEDLWNEERIKRNYIIYSITAGAALILGMCLARPLDTEY